MATFAELHVCVFVFISVIHMTCFNKVSMQDSRKYLKFAGYIWPIIAELSYR